MSAISSTKIPVTMATASEIKICSKASIIALISDTKSHEPEVTAVDVALSIEHILEEILKSVDTPTLKSCRLVSQTWMLFGTLELQTRIENRIKLSFYHTGDPHSFKETFVHQAVKTSTAVQKVIPEPPEVDPLQKLIGLIQNSPNFPCNSFILKTRQFEKPHIQSLLSSIGCVIKKLELNLDLVLSDNPCDLLMTGLKTLLTNQTPNLENLSITLHTPPIWSQYVMEWDRDLFEKKSKFAISLPKLKYLKIEGTLPKRAFQEIMDAAVNLKSLHLHQKEQFELTLSYFIDGNGKFRIHVLKHLNVHLRAESRRQAVAADICISILEKLLKQHSKNLALESIQIMNCVSSSHRRGEPQKLRAKADEVIGQILEGSSATLKKLVICNLTSLRLLKSIPQMPRLKTLELVEWEEINYDNNCYALFPSGFSIGLNFPALKSFQVNLDHSSFERDFLSKLFLMSMSVSSNYNNNCEGDDGTGTEADDNSEKMFVPITSVESVQLTTNNYTGKISDFTHEICSVIFPNARVTELEDQLLDRFIVWTF